MSHLVLPKHDSIPGHLISAHKYAEEARRFMPEAFYAQISGGAGDEITLAKNRFKLDALEILPRVLSDFKHATTAVNLLGETHPLPFLLAPVAHHSLVHPDGELASVAGADALGVGFTCSTLSSVSLEQIAAASAGLRWFQLYFQHSREITLDLIRRAESAGYQAIVVTVDAPISGLRNRLQASGFKQPESVQSANLVNYPQAQSKRLSSRQSVILDGYMADAPNWEDIRWLRQQTRLPLLLKGVLHPQDALQAKAIGLQGLVVSNHGGRTLDGLPASICCIEAIRAAAGEDFVVLFDSGIRRGSDIFKALALGANAVFIGRPYIYALAVAGALGVAHLLKILKEELEISMALAGCPTVDAINSHCLKRE